MSEERETPAEAVAEPSPAPRKASSQESRHVEKIGSDERPSSGAKNVETKSAAATQDEIEWYRTNTIRLEDEIHHFMQEKESHIASLRQIRLDLMQLQNERDAANLKLRDSQRAVKTFHAEVDSLKAEVRRQKAALQKYQQQPQASPRRDAELKGAHLESQTLRRSLSDMSVKHQGQSSKLKTELDHCKQQLEQCRQELEARNAERTQAEEDAEKMQIGLFDLNQQLSKAMAELSLGREIMARMIDGGSCSAGHTGASKRRPSH